MNFKQIRKIVAMLDDEIEQAQRNERDGHPGHGYISEAERYLTVLCTAMGYYAPRKIEREQPPMKALIGGEA